MKTLEKQIKKKYRSLSRFSILIRQPYSKVYADLHSGERAKLAGIRLLIQMTDDKPISGEVTPEQIAQVRKAYIDYPCKHKELVAAGIWPYWVETMFLKGKVLKVSDRVRRMFEVLDLNTKFY